MCYCVFMKEKLKQLRKEKKLTLKQIAEELNISVSAYSNYEQGIRLPNYDILLKIADFFDVSTDYLLGREEY